MSVSLSNMYALARGVICTISLLMFTITGFAQANNKPRIFLDCQMNCHTIYVKQEIQFVDYVRDRQVADIYILATSQRASAGAREVQLVFNGQQAYEGISDTLVFYYEANVSDTDDRTKLVKKLKEGLLPYLMKTDMKSEISYQVNVDNVVKAEDEIHDPWNFWSFNVGLNFNYDAEESNNEIDLGGRFSAQRVTEDEKLLFFTRYSYEKATFKIPDSDDIVSVLESYFFFTEYVKSLTDHWSIGLRADLGSSTFGNTDIDGAINPAIEYNIYPYSEASTKRFSFLYIIGPEYRDYTEETIFDKLTETLFRHEVRMEFEQIQKWGDVSVNGRFRQYLHNPKLYSVQINPNIELNLVKGLRLDIGGYIEYVGDRINIAKSDNTVEEILLQIKQLDTSYSLYSYIGINYRFGTQQNNIVNPRF